VIEHARNLGIPKEKFDFNPKGLQGLEKTGKWKEIPHFKIGPTHIPVEEGFQAPW